MSSDQLAKYVLEIKNLNKFYGKIQILKNISFTLKPGVIYGLIGHNGAGKTTIIKSIVNGIVDYKGEIKINGINARDSKSHKFLSYVPEDNFFIPGINVYDTIYFMSRLKNNTRTLSHQKTKALLEQFTLTKVQKNLTHKLSSGQRKKVLIAQALVHKPLLLILDEPAANLDPPTRIKLFEIIKKIINPKMTIIISSHILDELEKYIDNVIIIKNGEMKLEGNLNLLKLADSDTQRPLTIKFQTWNLQQFQDFLISQKNFKENYNFDQKTQEFIIKFTSKLEFKEFTNLAMQKNIVFSKIQRHQKTLNEIYINA